MAEISGPAFLNLVHAKRRVSFFVGILEGECVDANQRVHVIVVDVLYHKTGIE